MKASTILFFLFFTPIFNIQNHIPMEQHKIDQLHNLEEKYQALDALYSQHQELIDKYMKPELLQNFKKLGLFIEKEQEKLPEDSHEEGPQDIGQTEFEKTVRTILGNYVTKIVAKVNNNELNKVTISTKKLTALTGLFSQAEDYPIVEAVKSKLESYIKNNDGVSFEQIISEEGVKKALLTEIDVSSYYNWWRDRGKKLTLETLKSSFPNPEDVANAFINLADESDPRSPNSPDYIKEYAVWQDSLINELTDWSNQFADCKLGSRINELPKLFKNGDKIETVILGKVNELIQFPTHSELTIEFIKILKNDLNTEWLHSIYEEDTKIDLPDPVKIVATVNAAVDFDDLRNCANVEQLLAEMMEEEDYKTFCNYFDKFTTDLNTAVGKNTITNPKADADTAIVNLEIFINLVQGDADANNYPTAHSLSNFIDVHSPRPYVTVKDLRGMIDTWTGRRVDLKASAWFAQQFFLWNAGNQTETGYFPDPTKTAKAIYAASNVKITPEFLKKQLIAWANTIKNSLIDNTGRCLVKERLLSNLADDFSTAINGVDTMFIYGMIVNYLDAPSMKYSNAEKTEFSQANFESCVWTDSLLQNLSDEFVKKQFDAILNNYGEQTLKEFVGGVSLLLPDEKQIEQALRKSTCSSKVLIKPEMKDGEITQTVILSSGNNKLLEYTGFLIVPTEYKTAILMKDGEAKDVAFVIPQEIRIPDLKSKIKGGKATLIRHEIYNPQINESSGQCHTTASLKFEVEQNLETFFGYLKDEMIIRGEGGWIEFNWGQRLSDLGINLGPIGLSMEDMAGGEKTVRLIVDLDLTIKSTLKMTSLQEVRCAVESRTKNWKIVFSDGDTISESAIFDPEMKYKK